MKLNDSETEALREMGINALILFGSHAQGAANEASDYDFFVIGQKSKSVYDMLYDFLSEKIDKLVDIDIVFDEDAPMELKNHVCKYGVVLFQTKPNVFADFKERVMLEYSDFAPIREMFSNATLSRISL